MWSGQVVPALLASKIIKEKSRGAKVIWGGAQVTAIITEILKDKRFGTFVDGFISGHCEQSFVELISAIKKGGFGCPGLIIAGEGFPELSSAGGIPPPDPKFQDLSSYSFPKLILPIEVST